MLYRYYSTNTDAAAAEDVAELLEKEGAAVYVAGNEGEEESGGVGRKEGAERGVWTGVNTDSQEETEEQRRNGGGDERVGGWSWGGGGQGALLY